MRKLGLGVALFVGAVIGSILISLSSYAQGHILKALAALGIAVVAPILFGHALFGGVSPHQALGMFKRVWKGDLEPPPKDRSDLHTSEWMGVNEYVWVAWTAIQKVLEEIRGLPCTRTTTQIKLQNFGKQIGYGPPHAVVSVIERYKHNSDLLLEGDLTLDGSERGLFRELICVALDYVAENEIWKQEMKEEVREDNGT